MVSGRRRWITGLTAAGHRPPKETIERELFGPPDRHKGRPYLMMRTREPTRYWAGVRIRLSSGSHHPDSPAVLLAVSNSVTGNGFFFDPLPWIFVAAAVILISVLFWIPMVRNITRPLSRMTLATEEIAEGRFDVTIHEPRADEIGRLARGNKPYDRPVVRFRKGSKTILW